MLNAQVARDNVSRYWESADFFDKIEALSKMGRTSMESHVRPPKEFIEKLQDLGYIVHNDPKSPFFLEW